MAPEDTSDNGRPERKRRRPPRRRNPNRQGKQPKFRPGADPALGGVFSNIGIPRKKPFQPDPFQLEALEHIPAKDVLVTAPTGAGKTWIAVKGIESFFEKGGRSWYASPLKALSNSKYAEFCDHFGPGNVGILTGDRKENPDAPIIVGTTEILRNQLYDAMYHGENLAAEFVVLDEAHFLGNEERGVVWEEIMIYLPVRIPLMLLSATIGNADDIARWLAAIRRRPCEVVAETVRPVPLYPLFLHPTGMLYPLTVKDRNRKKKRIHKKVAQFLSSSQPRSLTLTPGNGLPHFDKVLAVLKKYRLLPAIFFLKSRADCDNALKICAQIPLTDPERQEHLEKRVAELLEGAPHVAHHRQRWHLENLALGAHHSGQLPAWKLLLENLMTEGLLDAVFATSTMSAGVNFPARTIVFLNSDRYNGREFVPLGPTEFHQMTGRAGRRGMDQIGFAVALPGRFMDIRLFARLLTASPAPVLSQIRINFSMVLNLLLSHNPDQIEELLQKSFANFLLLEQNSRAPGEQPARGSHRAVWIDFLRHLNFLKENGYVAEDDTLTPDGEWASQLRIDQPLMIAEGFKLGILPDRDPALLTGVVAAFVNERETDDRIPRRMIPKRLLSTFLGVKKGLRPFTKLMELHGFEVRPLFLRPAVTLYAWAAGEPWEKVHELSELAEGDLAMLILRTADNLRHIKALAGVFPQAAEAAAQGVDAILKEPVVMGFQEPETDEEEDEEE